MYNAALRSIKFDATQFDPTDPVAIANDEYAKGHRSYGVSVADLGAIGLGDQFKGTQSPVYTNTENHIHLSRCNPRFIFDNIDLDRLMTAAINREWQREDH